MLQGQTVPARSAPSFLTVLWIVLICQAVFLSFLRNGASFDGAEQLLYTQYLDLGYGRSQPPLYTWLLILSQQVFGVTLLAENLLKFALAGAAFTAIHLAARQLWKSATAGHISVLLCLLVPEILWEMQRNYSHSVLLLALVAAVFCAYLSLLKQPGPARFAGFGLLLGLLLLSKYNAVLIILALAGADLWVMRRLGVFARPQTLLALGVAALVVAPHLYWASQNPGAVAAMTGSFEIGAAGGVVRDWAQGISSLGLAILTLAVPVLLFVLVVLGPRATLGLTRAARVAAKDPASVFVLAMLLYLGLSLAITLFSHTTNVRARWLLPVVVPFTLWLGGQMPLHAPRAVRALNRLALALAALASIGLVVEELRPGARTASDYARLESDLRQTLQADALLFTEYQTFANLRLYDADLVLVSPAMPRLPDLQQTTHPVAIWSGQAGDGQSILQFAAGLGLVPQPGTAPVPLMLHRSFGDPRAVFAQALSPQAAD